MTKKKQASLIVLFCFYFFKHRQQKPQGRLFSFYRKQLPLTSFDTVPASSAFSFSSSSSLSTTSSGRMLSPQRYKDPSLPLRDWPLIFNFFSKEGNDHSSQETESNVLPGWGMGNNSLLNIQWIPRGPSALEQQDGRAPFEPDMTEGKSRKLKYSSLWNRRLLRAKRLEEIKGSLTFHSTKDVLYSKEIIAIYERAVL